MTDFQTLEALAREICDSRNKPGHYDAKGTKRAHWRRVAQTTADRASEIGELDWLLSMFGIARVKE